MNIMAGRAETYAEHIMRIFEDSHFREYRAEVAGHFFSEQFQRGHQIQIWLRQAGMGLFGHHRQASRCRFAMWPTKVNDYNVMDATPWRHDPDGGFARRRAKNTA